jgi:hypothetical protein
MMTIALSVSPRACLVDVGALAGTAEEVGFESFGRLRDEIELPGGDFDHR